MERELFLEVFGYPLKDPIATCQTCGAMGTVGRAIQKRDDREVFHAQFCFGCWPAESARLQAQWDEETYQSLAQFSSTEGTRTPALQSSMAAATWHGVAAFIRDHIVPTQQSATLYSRSELSRIATSYQQIGGEYVGEMPPTVAEFIRTNANSAGSAAPDPAT